MGGNSPEWAWQRMRDLKAMQPFANPTEVAFAAYIAQHEEAPVDPLNKLLGEAIAAAAARCVFSVDDDLIQSDGADNRAFIGQLREELVKRGIEIPREGGAK